MPTLFLNNPARTACRKRPHGAIRGARTLATAATLAGLLLGSFSAVSEAAATGHTDPGETTSSAAATPTPTPTPNLNVAAATAITSPVDGAFIGSNSVEISGTKDAGSTVAVTIAGTAACESSAAATAFTTWSCTSPIASGADIAIVATEELADGTTSATSIQVDVLGPPTIDGASPQLTTGVISGSGYPNARISLKVGAGSQSCDAPVAPSGYWSCAIASPSGRYGVSATQAVSGIGAAGDSSGPSAAVTVNVDKSPPAAPRITSPKADSRTEKQPISITGTGELGGLIDVYVDGIPRCSTTITRSTWSCAATGFTIGSNTVQAVLRDAAGNYATGNSAPIRLFFGPGPVKVLPPETQEDQPGPSEAPRFDEIPWTETPFFPGPDGQGPTLREALTNWGTPTTFGAGLPTLAETVTRGNWLWGAIIAALFIGLIALPLRLVAGAVRGRFRQPHLTGRNQLPTPAEEETPRNPWLLGVVPLAATAGLIVLAEGLNGEVRYLRLLFAVGLGLSILNVVGVAITTRLASRWQDVGSRLRFLPMLIIAAAIAAVVSRLTGIEPPVVSGVLIGSGYALAVNARPRAIVNLLQVGAIMVLAILGWLGHSLVGPVVGFWPSILSETLATICLAGIGSGLILMLPIGKLPGRVILEWSPSIWLATSFTVTLIVAVIILGGPAAHLPGLVSLLILVAFAAVCVTAWAWINYSKVAGATSSGPSPRGGATL